MDWGQFWTLIAQVLIAGVVAFVVSAGVAGAIQGFKERRK